MPVEGRSRTLGVGGTGDSDRTTGEDRHGSNDVWRIPGIRPEKAKPDPGCRFSTPRDTVWSLECLWEAYQRVGLNAGRVGLSWGWTERPSIPLSPLRTMAWIDGEYGLGDRARDLSDPHRREKTDTPRPVRPVRIPKKQPGAFRPPARLRVFPVSGTGWPGTGCGWLRPRPGLCWSRSLRPTGHRTRRPIARNGARTMRSRMVSKDRHRLLNTGHHEVVDGDLSNSFGEIPIHPSRRSDDALCPPHPRWVEAQTDQGRVCWCAGEGDGGDGGDGGPGW